jgi:hypothetical protein
VTKYQQEVPLHTHHKDLYVLAFLGREATVLVYVRPFVQDFIIKWLGGLESVGQRALPIDKRELAIVARIDGQQSNDAFDLLSDKAETITTVST